MWDEEDYTSRWVQGISSIILAALAVVFGYLSFHYLLSMYMIGGIALFFGCVRLAWRCGFYAITGKNNVNRDDY